MSIFRNTIYIILFVAIVVMGSDKNRGKSNSAKVKVVKSSEVKWEFLNPARGDKSPMAGTLWGDRNGTEATGFLLKPTDGFKSPPHIHNVSYRGIVIQGLIHNDDPDAENMWMSGGSYWTQPKGEVHITAAKGTNTLAYIEIEEGPYLVHPAADKFHTNERPVNVDKTNIVWVNASDLIWVEKNGPEVAYLWGTPDVNKLHGTLLKIPAGYEGSIITQNKTFGAVIIKGDIIHKAVNETELTNLDKGSYFGSSLATEHKISASEVGAILYIRSGSKYRVSNK